jgi:hypothetical protein
MRRNRGTNQASRPRRTPIDETGGLGLDSEHSRTPVQTADHSAGNEKRRANVAFFVPIVLQIRPDNPPVRPLCPAAS